MEPLCKTFTEQGYLCVCYQQIPECPCNCNYKCTTYTTSNNSWIEDSILFPPPDKKEEDIIDIIKRVKMELENG